MVEEARDTGVTDAAPGPAPVRWRVGPSGLRRALDPFVAGKEADLPYVVVDDRSREQTDVLDELLRRAFLDWGPPEHPPDPGERPGAHALEPCTRSHAERVLVRAFHRHLAYHDVRMPVAKAAAAAALLVGQMPSDARWSTNVVLCPDDGPVDEIRGWSSVSPYTFDLAVVGTSADRTLAVLDVDED
ncbi:hypothetical protein [Cellulosimicrobium cellulans]|jgi:hypothetical protein|uniref:Uncharacterized protein n=1 Tax=Cellulosimicrobium cellulans TaxID=1710 RepID=A0A4Y4E582_CELCE|nr:hypothetical protein [Cellulosimicrobium cellulans]GED11184.1 hypothetical protein CCE02nite_31830 [Cellulosimicrobium cellulans]